VYCGQGERTESVSHTVPNMASADQSPHQSIARNTCTRRQIISFSFISCPRGKGAKVNNNRLKLARSSSFRAILGGRGTRVERRELDGGLRRNKSSRGENAQSTRSVRTEILKAKLRKGDGEGIKHRLPLHPNPLCFVRLTSQSPSKQSAHVCTKPDRTSLSIASPQSNSTIPHPKDDSRTEKPLGRCRRRRSGQSSGWCRSFLLLFPFPIKRSI
jgi:hypothetical protein